jgi:glutamyl/glutaminyl-tRNA synthetase
MKNYFWAFILIGLIGLGLVYLSIYPQKVASYVTISINPEVELALTEEGVVLEVLAINDDADILIADLELEGLTVEEATDELLDAAVETGFIDELSEENEVVVTTVNEDETTRMDLETLVLARIRTRLQTKEIAAVVMAEGLTDELKAQADSYDINYGKMLLVNRVLDLDSELSKETVVNMTVKEIQELIKTKVEERKEQVKETTKEMIQLKEELKTEYQTRINEAKEEMLNQNGVDTTSMTEEQKEEAVSEMVQAKKDEIAEKVEQIKTKVEEAVQNSGEETNIRETIRNARTEVDNGNSGNGNGNN